MSPQSQLPEINSGMDHVSEHTCSFSPDHPELNNYALCTSIEKSTPEAVLLKVWSRDLPAPKPFGELVKNTRL